MSMLSRVRTWIDALTARVGRAASWLILGMVLLGAFNAVARYLSKELGADLSSNAYLEAQWYMFSLVFLLAAAHTLRRDAHVRVDVFYGRLGPRGQAWINLAGSVLFLVPFCIFILWMSYPSVMNSWAVREVSPDPGGLPRYPIKAAILVSFGLLLLQAIAEIIRNIETLSGRHETPHGERKP
jgi:TRAP-type mannitol/chloroaromatic compound transport system permease small subunit